MSDVWRHGPFPVTGDTNGFESIAVEIALPEGGGVWQGAIIPAGMPEQALEAAFGQLEHILRENAAKPRITCPRCGATFWHPDDIRHGYCGRCHSFTSHMPPPGDQP